MPKELTTLPPGIVLMSRLTLLRCLGCFALLCSFAGCSTYQNVTGYFNTYYNARKQFGDAVEEVERAQLKGRDTVYYVSYVLQPATKAKFKKVIEKCSKLIESFQQSSWVDDGIVMIGKSYVYLDENEAAKRKFRELLDNFPASGLRRDAMLWHAKADYFVNNDVDALKMLKELFPEAREEGDNDVLLETLMLEGQIYLDREEYEQSATTYALAVEVSGDSRKRAAALYQLGLIRVRLQNYEQAAATFAQVREYTADPELEFRSRIKYAQTLSQAGDHQQALRILDAMLEEPLKKEELGLVNYEIAVVDWAIGDTANAFLIFNLIDTVYAKTDASAKAMYFRGNLYEKRFFDYAMAKSFYVKAKDQFPASEVTPLAVKRSASFTNYFKYRGDVHTHDSLLLVAAKNDSIALAKGVARADSIAPGARDSLIASSDSASVKHDSTLLSNKSDVALNDEKVQQDTAKLSMKEPLTDDEDDDEREVGRKHEIIPGRRTMPKPRVQDADRALARPGKDAGNDTTRRTPKPTPPVGRAGLSPDSLRALASQARFELGGLFLLELQLPDSARAWFQSVVNDFPQSRFVPRSIYALAEIARTEHDTAATDSLYRIILEKYSKTDFADHVKKILGMEVAVLQPDSVALTYQMAEEVLASGKIDEARKIFTTIALERRSPTFSPKAYYTVGWIYENLKIENDSAAAWYQRLVEAYPQSMYASAVSAKIAVKKDPKTLSQFIHVREFQPLPKVESPFAQRKKEAARLKDEADRASKVGRRDGAIDVGDEDADVSEEDEPVVPDEDDDNNPPS